MARPIAKRRAELLGGIALPDGGKDSLLFASGCGPVLFDLDYSLFSGHESEAADRSVRSTQTKPPAAPPIHALLGFGERSAASPRALVKRAKSRSFASLRVCDFFDFSAILSS